MIHKISRGPYILRPRDRVFYALKTVCFQLKTVYISPRPYIFRQDRIFYQERIFYFSGPYILLSYHEIIGRSNVGEAYWWKMYVGEKPVCWWNLKFFQEHTFHQHTFKFLFKMFTNIQKTFRQHTSPTYI